MLNKKDLVLLKTHCMQTATRSHLTPAQSRFRARDRQTGLHRGHPCEPTERWCKIESAMINSKELLHAYMFHTESLPAPTPKATDTAQAATQSSAPPALRRKTRHALQPYC